MVFQSFLFFKLRYPQGLSSRQPQNNVLVNISLVVYTIPIKYNKVNVYYFIFIILLLILKK